LILHDLSKGSLITTANLTIHRSRFSDQLSSAGHNRQNTWSWKHGFMLPMLPHSYDIAREITDFTISFGSMFADRETKTLHSDNMLDGGRRNNFSELHF